MADPLGIYLEDVKRVVDYLRRDGCSVPWPTASRIVRDFHQLQQQEDEEWEPGYGR